MYITELFVMYRTNPILTFWLDCLYEPNHTQ